MINAEPWKGGTDEEYETQLFGFGSQRLKIAMRQMVEEKVNNNFTYMETHLAKLLGLNEDDKVILSNAFNKIKTLYFERAKSSFKNIDSEIERVLEVPRNVLLPEDEVQINQFTDDEYEKLKDEVKGLRKRAERGALMEALLKTEENEINSIQHVYETAKKDMQVVDMMCKSIEGNSVKKIQNETFMLCASAPFMNETKLDNIIFNY